MALLATMASASAKAGAIQREVRGRSVVKAGKWIISDEDMGDIIGILGASMLGNMLTGRCVVRAGKDVIRAGKG